MTFAFVQSNSSSNSNTVALTGVTAGNLIAVCAKWENSKNNIAVTDGTTSLSLGTRADSVSADGVMSQIAYLLSANGGSKTYTATFPSGTVAGTRCLIVFEFSYANTAVLDVQNIGNGSGAAASTGNVTTTGSPGLAFGNVGMWSSSQEPASNYTVNSVTADGSVEVSIAAFPDGAAWYKILSATFSAGNAACDFSGSDEWACNIITFKETGGGGASTGWGPLLGGARNRNVVGGLS